MRRGLRKPNKTIETDTRMKMVRKRMLIFFLLPMPKELRQSHSQATTMTEPLTIIIIILLPSHI